MFPMIKTKTLVGCLNVRSFNKKNSKLFNLKNIYLEVD